MPTMTKNGGLQPGTRSRHLADIRPLSTQATGVWRAPHTGRGLSELREKNNRYKFP